MLKDVKRALRGLFNAEGQERIGTPLRERAAFKLQLGDLEIGCLELDEGMWEFKYSPAFIAQVATNGVQTLVDFPDHSKVYRSSELWPFFMARIPSLSQPRVQEKIEEQGLDETNASQLLQEFGEWSIANPFQLLLVRQEPSRAAGSAR